MNSALDMLQQATLELTSADPIKERLTAVYLKYLEQLDLDHLPPQVRRPLSDLVNRLTAVSPLTGETSVTATVRKMSREEAAECSREIVRVLLSAISQGEYEEIKQRKPSPSAPLWALEA